LTEEIENINELIAGCKADDRKTQEKLYRNYYRAMMSLCLRYTKNEEDALEVLNTGFLKIFRSIHRYDAVKASLFTWMRTIIVNSCLDFVKSKQLHSQTGELNDTIEIEIQPDIISKMKAGELLRLVRELPPATQAVFNLYVTEGYNHKEIGKLMGISEGTSKWHVSEARKILQQKIRERQLS
jgi:RNA polymerase sigma-70 factor (ECF subfamily)